MTNPGHGGGASPALVEDARAQIAACVALSSCATGSVLVVAGDEPPYAPDGATVHRIRTAALGGTMGQRLPFVDGAFDTVVVFDVFERAGRRRSSLARELARVCTGAVIVVTPVTARRRSHGPDGLGDLMRWRVGDVLADEIRLCGRLTSGAPGASRADVVGGAPVQPDRSHALVHFSLDGRRLPTSWRWYGRRTRRDLDRVDPRNPLQAAGPASGGSWARWSLTRGSIGMDGAVAGPDGAGRLTVTAPPGAMTGLRVSFGVLDGYTPGAVGPSVTDSTGVVLERDGDVRADDGRWCLDVRATSGGDAGHNDFHVDIPSGCVVSSVDVLRATGPVVDLGVEVRPGPNLTLLTDDEIRLTWHLESDVTGWVPAGHVATGAPVSPAPIAVQRAWRRRAAAPLDPYPWDLVHMFQRPGGFVLPMPWEPSGGTAEVGASHDANGAAPLRILLVSHMFPVPANPVSGAFVFESARSLVASGAAVVRVVCPVPFWGPTWRMPRAWRAARRLYGETLAEAIDRRFVLDGVEVVFLPYYVPARWERHGDAVDHAVRAATAEIERFGPHVVHAHSGYVDGWAASRLARRLGVPLVVTEHTGPLARLFDHRAIGRRVRRAYEAASSVLGVSEFQAAEIRRLVPSVAARVEVQHNGYDSDVYGAGTRTGSAGPRVLYVGYITGGKGLEQLVRAFASLVPELPEAELLIAGDVADPGVLAVVLDEVRRARIEGNVRLVGGCTRAQVAALMRSCDVLVLPSEAETFGCVLVEALGSGLAAVSTRCGGPEDIAAGESALTLVPVGDPAALSDAIARSWRQRSDAERTPSAVAARAHARFSYDVIAAQLIDRYRSLARNRPQTRRNRT